MRLYGSLLFLCVFTCFLAAGVLAVPGDTVRTLTAPSGWSRGLTFDGNYLWSADQRTDQLYKIDPADGTVSDSLPTPAYNTRGLTWDGQRLWAVDASEQLIYAIHPATGIIEKTIYCPVSDPTGLAWDGAELWICDDGANQIHQISSEDGTTITTIPSPSGHPRGLTFDGTYFWVGDRYDDKIYMITPEHGDVVITLDAPGPNCQGLAWDGTHLWNIDYQTDRIYQLVVEDGTLFSRMNAGTHEVDVVQETRNFGPDSVLTLDVYLAVPSDMNNQELIGELQYSPEPDEIITDKWGQQIARFHVENLGPNESRTVTMTARARLYQNRYFVRPEKVGALSDIPEDIRQKYLVNDTKFSMQDEVIQSALKKAIGDETNPYWMARRIFRYVIDNMEYELAGGWNVAPAVLERGNGSCSEYSFVYISMCRAAGIPTRYVGSVVIRGDDASRDDVFHRWVEVYLPNYGWVPVDPSGGDSSWPSRQANAFGFLNNRYLITTAGGGGSEYLEWGYNVNEMWTSRGKAKVDVEHYAEWTPLTVD